MARYLARFELGPGASIESAADRLKAAGLDDSDWHHDDWRTGGQSTTLRVRIEASDESAAEQTVREALGDLPHRAIRISPS